MYLSERIVSKFIYKKISLTTISTRTRTTGRAFRTLDYSLSKKDIIVNKQDKILQCQNQESVCGEVYLKKKYLHADKASLYTKRYICILYVKEGQHTRQTRQDALVLELVISLQMGVSKNNVTFMQDKISLYTNKYAGTTGSFQKPCILLQRGASIKNFIFMQDNAPQYTNRFSKNNAVSFQKP